MTKVIWAWIKEKVISVLINNFCSTSFPMLTLKQTTTISQFKIVTLRMTKWRLTAITPCLSIKWESNVQQLLRTRPESRSSTSSKCGSPPTVRSETLLTVLFSVNLSSSATSRCLFLDGLLPSSSPDTLMEISTSVRTICSQCPAELNLFLHLTTALNLKNN